MELISVDIGGTNARFCLATVADDGTISLGEPAYLATEAHASFETAWEQFAAQLGRPLPRAAALSVAAPVGGDTISFTNNHWVIQPALLQERLGVDAVTVVNDFGAVGHAVARARPSDFLHLAGPDVALPASGTISIVGPGTGLGVAQLWRSGLGDYHVQATEGGHIDYAPLDAIEDAILARLRRSHRRVSVERVVSGQAIVDIYETLAALEGRATTAHKPAEVWKLAETGEDSLALAARDRFCLSLGSAAGDFALAHGASGVVIAGGVGFKQRAAILASGFGERFRAKGRFEKLMDSLPVKIITHPEPGLLGAAAAFAKEHNA